MILEHSYLCYLILDTSILRARAPRVRTCLRTRAHMRYCARILQPVVRIVPE
jgi:hypothetical protein